MTLPRFAQLAQRVNQRVLSRLADALLALPVTAPAEPVWLPIALDKELSGGMLAPMGAADAHTVRMRADGLEGVQLLEGDTVLIQAVAFGGFGAEQACRIAGPVDIDSTGWLTFEVYPT